MSRPSAAVAVIIGLGLSGLAWDAAYAHQPEPEYPCSLGLPGPLVYGSHTSGCELAAGNSIDPFTFAADDGDLVRVIGHAETPGVDLSLQVEDPLGSLVAQGQCEGGTAQVPMAPCTVELEFETGAGTHTILVSDAGGDEAGSYLLQLEVLPGYDSDEVDDRPSFTDILFLIPSTDVDQRGHEAEAGEELGIHVEAEELVSDPRVEVFAPSGAPVAADSCTSAPGDLCTFDLAATVDESGTFLFVFSEVDADALARIRFTITRVPEPTPGALALATLAGLAAVAWRHRGH